MLLVTAVAIDGTADHLDRPFWELRSAISAIVKIGIRDAGVGLHGRGKLEQSILAEIRTRFRHAKRLESRIDLDGFGKSDESSIIHPSEFKIQDLESGGFEHPCQYHECFRADVAPVEVQIRQGGVAEEGLC